MRFAILAVAAGCCFAAEPAVRVYEGAVTIPTWVHTARETEPPLFGNSTVSGAYPYTTYLAPFTPDSPRPREWRAVFVENEYLKLTWLPELGGRIFSLYDKLRGREVFYRNDAIKPTSYNPRNGWPVTGLELTGPADVHMLTLYGEPFWAHRIVQGEDGSVSLVLGQLDPFYDMKVNFTATLHPGVAALEMTVFCYNGRAGRMPQMFWMSAAVAATPKLRFIYPMTRTIGHKTGEVADWPVYKGVDESWDRNNLNALGVFGIDVYDNFEGAYEFDRDYGIFRWADRRVTQGMKLWTWGYGPSAKDTERGYTDKAGPYVEVQSGRHVWDGHYEWVAPHQVETWSDWWVPVAGTGGLTTLTRDVALHLDRRPDALDVALYGTRVVRGARLLVTAKGREIGSQTVDLDPSKPIHASFPAPGGEPADLAVKVSDSAANVLLDYHAPDANPGAKEYTPFTRPLERPAKDPARMTAEELTAAAEFKLKERNVTEARALLTKALALDPGYSRALLQTGIQDFTSGSFASAAASLEKAIERDPYLDEAYYYLAMAQLALGDERKAERNLYYIRPESGYYGAREFNLGRLAFLRGDAAGAEEHLKSAVARNASDLSARLLLAVNDRERGRNDAALRELAEVERIDPTNRPARAERFFLTKDEGSRQECARLMGGQSQEALGVSAFYRDIARWKEAAEVLRWTQRDNHDPFGTPPEFYYTLAYCLRRAGDGAAAEDALRQARGAAGHVDRFPYRLESEAPLAEAVKLDPSDAVARYLLGCLFYDHERRREAIAQWEAGIAAKPDDFSTRRALGLAYAAEGEPLTKSAPELLRAVGLHTGHGRTFEDLSALYGRAGTPDKQEAALKRTLDQFPNDDNLAEGAVTVYLAWGDYAAADKLMTDHRFAPSHPAEGLRETRRLTLSALAAKAFHKRDYAGALRFLDAALQPPESPGADNSQVPARIEYYRGRTLEKLGRAAEARSAYERAAARPAGASGDRNRSNIEDFFAASALDRLGRGEEARQLRKKLADAGEAQKADRDSERRAEALYLLALLRAQAGDADGKRKLLQEALQSRSDLLAAGLENRGDLIDVAK